MVTTEEIGMFFLNQSGLISIGLLFVFLVGILILVIWLWYTNRLPIHWYPYIVLIRGRVGDMLAPRALSRARVYTSASGNKYLAIRKWGFGAIGLSEVKGIPLPTDDKIYPNNEIEVVQRGADQYETIVVKEDQNKKIKVNYEETERWKQAFRDMERDRISRKASNNLLLQLLPYGMIIVTVIGCFLIISVLATPMTTISGQAATAMKEYKAASETNLKIAELMNAGKNGTVPPPNPEPKPPG